MLTLIKLSLPLTSGLLSLALFSPSYSTASSGEMASELISTLQMVRTGNTQNIKDNDTGTTPPALDTDMDGVTDDADLCPDTPNGETVDSDGCSDSQKDSDTDGVADDIDLCPNTPIGESVDSDGCSASQNDPEASVKQVYEDDVNKLIVSAAGGCTSSGCHGRAGAPGGLRLYSAGEDNNITLNYESFVRYIGSNSADKLMTKISGGSGHGGRTRYRSDTAEFATIEAWAISVEALP